MAKPKERIADGAPPASGPTLTVLSGKGGKWVVCGQASQATDGTITVSLDWLPVNGTLIIRRSQQ